MLKSGRGTFRWIVGAFILGWGALQGHISFAQSEFNQGKIRVEGSTLIYDTFIGDGADAEINYKDTVKFPAILQRHPNITRIELNSGGGSIWAGEEIARIVLDFELDTHVNGECSSSCVSVFLAGQTRTMARGSKIGFHQNYWGAESIQFYFKDNRSYQEWESPFDMASWLYRDTQTETFNQLQYMVNRGVDPAFAIQTKRPTDSLWYPTRAELLAGGVLTEP